jgi:hypothetical protein
LYTIYINQQYTDLSSFLFGVANHNGEAYALSINDPALFKKFAGKYRLNSNKPEYIMDRIDYRISSYNVARAEEFFTKFIKGSGLVLLKMNNTDSSQNTWSAIEYNTATKQIITQEQPCD